MGNYADPNVDDREFLVKVKYASDPLSDAPFRRELVAKLEALANAEGVDLEVVTRETMTHDINAALHQSGGYRSFYGSNEEVAATLAKRMIDDGDWDPPLRFAKVWNARDSREIAQYLPANYHYAGGDTGAWVICGQDDAGWTLNDYVIPRLASGLLGCEEITQDEALALVDAAQVGAQS